MNSKMRQVNDSPTEKSIRYVRNVKYFIYVYFSSARWLFRSGYEISTKTILGARFVFCRRRALYCVAVARGVPCCYCLGRRSSGHGTGRLGYITTSLLSIGTR